MELKTLKDFRREWNEVIKDRDGHIINLINLVNAEELKKEAIKWVKEIGRITSTDIILSNWIKHFFNISEDDLK